MAGKVTILGRPFESKDKGGVRIVLGLPLGLRVWTADGEIWQAGWRAGHVEEGSTPSLACERLEYALTEAVGNLSNGIWTIQVLGGQNG